MNWNTGGVNEHYFTEHPSGESELQEITVSLNSTEVSVLTAGGVFSPDHVDTGTRVLLDTLADEPEVSGSVLDLGCGWGPIALTAALRNPGAHIWAVDINSRARELARTNAQRLQLSNVSVAEPSEIDEGLRFAAIHSNPPIRVGKAALHELLSQWLPRLEPGGAATLVVAKHLGAQSLLQWITESFPDYAVSRIARDKGFFVIQAVRPSG